MHIRGMTGLVTQGDFYFSGANQGDFQVIGNDDGDSNVTSLLE